jgi:hypothetical protein
MLPDVLSWTAVGVGDEDQVLGSESPVGLFHDGRARAEWSVWTIDE